MSGGGGGGNGWSSGSGEAIGARIDRAVANATASDSYKAEANAYLQDLLADYNNRDADGIRRHLETIKQAVERDIDGEVEMLFGGSVRKHTYVDGLSDVDALMTVNSSELASAVQLRAVSCGVQETPLLAEV